MKNVTVKLSEPVTFHSAPWTEITLRAPIARDYFEFGEIGQFVQRSDGTSMYVEDNDALSQYIAGCAVGDNADLVVKLISLADAMALKQVIRGFFVDAVRSQSDNAATSSSSTSDGLTAAPSLN